MSRPGIVILSWDGNPFYEPCVGPVVSAWERMGFSVDICRDTEATNPGIPSEAWAKIRRMIRASEVRDASIISDIDMLPISEECFHVMDASPGYLTCYGGDCPTGLPMCYMVAHPATWREILDIGDMAETMKRWEACPYPNGRPSATPHCDETLLRWLLESWRPSRVIAVRRGWSSGLADNRIDRAAWKWDTERLKNNGYIDAHLPRGEGARELIANLLEDICKSR